MRCQPERGRRMASLQERCGSYRVQFLYHGKRESLNVGKVSLQEAEAWAGRVEFILLKIRQGLLEVPPGSDICEFIRADGKPAARDRAPTTTPIVLGKLRERYLTTHSNGSLEKTTLDGIRLHFRHLVATLGESFPLASLGLAELQKHVDRRATAKGIGGKLSPATIRKEIVTLRTAWNWAVQMGLVSGRFPNKGLRYPKRDEKPPFQTRAEIERRVAGGGLTSGQISELWDALFLPLPEVEELLAHVREQAGQPWVYPLFCFAAHTGARRSEMIRAQTSDVDFEGRTVLLREKKRAHDRRTTRRVPLTPFLAGVLKDWQAEHPGGPHLFCHAGVVARSKKRSRLTGHQSGENRPSTLKGRAETLKAREDTPGPSPLTKDECHDHFKRVLSRSKWDVIRGWHVCRHSFASNCAAAGVDQRLIDAWLGHTTEIRRRYLHLVPANEQRAIDSVFGQTTK